jgi:hypothetical protein
MPRGARLDAPGALHHVMVRGIERTAIVIDDEDRLDFLNRIGKASDKTGTVIYVISLGCCQTAGDFEGSSEPDFGTLKKAVRGISRLSASRCLNYLRPLTLRPLTLSCQAVLSGIWRKDRLQSHLTDEGKASR